MAELNSIFCVSAEKLEEPNCSINFEIYEDSCELTIKLLALFKTFIPKIALNVNDCQGHPIKVLQKDICITPPEKVPPILILLTPTDDTSSYGEDFSSEDTKFLFEVYTEVVGSNQECNIWNLTKIQNIIKTLIINLEKVLKGYSIEFDGFRFIGADSIGKGDYSRSGLCRFKVTRKSRANILEL